MAMKKVTGWYEEHDRSSDFTGELTDPLTGVVSKPPSMTKQEFVAECDINNILREFTMTGQIAHVSALAAQGAFMDLPEAMDYQESLNTIMAAEATFDRLPSKIRDRFNNDPEEFLGFFNDPANLAEARELGLATPAPLDEPAPPLPTTVPDSQAK